MKNGDIRDISETLVTAEMTQKLSGLEKMAKEEWNSKTIIEHVQSALKEKGYNPVNQLVGYILSGDPTYITGHNNARNVITKIERDEILEEMVRSYLENL